MTHDSTPFGEVERLGSAAAHTHTEDKSDGAFHDSKEAFYSEV